MAPQGQKFPTLGWGLGRVESGNTGQSQDTSDFRFQRKDTDVLSSNYLLTESWNFLGLSDNSCELLWLWVLPSVPTFPTLSFSSEILSLHIIQIPIRFSLYCIFFYSFSSASALLQWEVSFEVELSQKGLLCIGVPVTMPRIHLYGSQRQGLNLLTYASLKSQMSSSGAFQKAFIWDLLGKKKKWYTQIAEIVNQLSAHTLLTWEYLNLVFAGIENF